MKVEVKEKSPIEKTMAIEVEPERYEKILDKVLKKITSEVAIPGFRKGKAPKTAVIRRVGLQAVKQDLLNELIPEVSVEAMEEHDINPISTPVCTPMNEINLEEGQPINFVLTFEVLPEFELQDYKGLELIRIVRDVNVDEAVENQIKAIQEQMGTMIPLEEDRPLKEGDVAHVDFRSFKQDDTPIEGGSASDYYMTLEEGNFIPGFFENVVGKRAGDEFEFDVTFPEEYSNKSLAGQSVRFKMHVKTLMKKELPERDDEFAKSAGNYQTFEEMKNDIEKKVRESIETQQKNEMQEQALAKLVSQLDSVPIPNSLVESHLKRMMQNMMRQAESYGKSFDNFLKDMNISKDKFIATMFPQARNAAKSELIINKIIEQEKIEVSEEELNKELEGFAARLKQDVASIRKSMERDNYLDVLRYELRNRKVFDMLIENAVITEKKPEEVMKDLEAAQEKIENEQGEVQKTDESSTNETASNNKEDE